MTFQNAIHHFQQLLSEASNKSEIKVYQDFIDILSSLEKKGLTESEIQAIEKELDALVITRSTTNNKKYFSNALRQLKDYLKENFSFITKGYYTSLGITFGASIGLLVGIIFLSSLERSLGIAMGISVGTAIGIITANYLDSQAEASGNLI